jgi:hypothetical protein
MRLVFVYSFFVFAFLFLAISVFGQTPKGTIKGIITESGTKLPLTGANILIKDLNQGAMSDADGKFEITNVPVGSRVVVISYIGYESVVKTDIVVRPDRQSFIETELKPSQLNMDEVVVSAGYFSETESTPISANNFSAEEIRRAPGSAGDVSRIIMGLPSIAKINDTKNSLIVRGGSPSENAFYLDNIEIPNINHYPIQGSSAGPIGLINVDFIKDVNLLTGGFSSVYGDKLSSIMELKFREGNRDEFNMQLDASMQGVGATLEGPINSGKGSYMVSARRCFFDLIFKTTDINGPIPKYSDFQGKVVYDISDRQKIAVLDILSQDFSFQNREEGYKFDSNQFGKFNMLNNTIGINWQYLWGAKGYSEVSAAHTYMDYDYNSLETRTGLEQYTNRSKEQQVTVRNNNHYNIGKKDVLDFGFDTKFMFYNYDNRYFAYTDKFGNTTPDILINSKYNTTKAGVFASYTFEPLNNVSITAGARADYFDYNETTSYSPRLTATYNFSPVTSVHAAAGLFHQSLPFVLLTQSDEYKKLKNPEAIHYIFGFTHLLTADTKLTIEGYDKEYRNSPMDPSEPEFFMIDQSVSENSFLGHGRLVDNGKAYSRGVELTIQKKLASDFYGLIGASYSRARYRDLNGQWRSRIYDNRFSFTVDGGYKPNENWEFSMRWMYAGGAPYTPYNSDLSAASGTGIYDLSRVNHDRLPDYHSLNLRVDRRFNFQSSSLVVYLSLWNVYARENVISYYWNEIDNKLSTEKMWSLMPIFGLEYEL